MLRFRLVLTVLLGLTARPVAAQTARGDSAQIRRIDAVEKPFADGITAFGRGTYGRAYNLFRSVYRDQPTNQRTTAAWLMAGRSLYRQKLDRQAMETLEAFAARFPGSGYRDDALYTAGLAAFHAGDGKAAVRLLGGSFEASESSVARDAIALAEAIGHYSLSAVDYAAAYRALPGPRSRGVLLPSVARALLFAGRGAEAETILSAFMAEQPRHPDRNEVAALLDEAKREADGRTVGGFVTIGALVPLFTGESSVKGQLGREVLSGIDFAVREWQAANPSRQLRLVFRDTGHDPTATRRAAESLIADDGVDLIVGPVFSETAVAAAAVARARQVPLLSPTATDDSLATFGEFVATANPTYGMRGRLMARFAKEKLGYSTVGVLSSDRGYGANIAAGFRSGARAAGLRVTFDQSLPPGLVDIGDFVARLRSNPPDALYLPLTSRDQLARVAATLASNNLPIQLLGADDWADPTLIAASGGASQNIVYAADNVVPTDDRRFDAFARAFRERTGYPPTRNTLYGYDAMQLVLEALRDRSVTDRAALARKLRTTTVRGFHNTLELAGGPINTRINTFRLTDGQLRRLE